MDSFTVPLGPIGAATLKIGGTTLKCPIASWPRSLVIASADRELLRITPEAEVIAPSLEAASEAGRVFVESVRHHLKLIGAQ
jgi:hypothetical protein